MENKLPGRSNSNRFALLAENEPEQAQETQPKPKPPPIYFKEKISNALVKKIVALTVDGNFHVVPVSKGDIHETKLKTKSEEHFRAVSKYLEEAGKSYYTYQLKSSKGLQVVLKGTEPDVTATEVIDALKEKGFSAKNVSNIINRKKGPQPLFRVELESDSRVLTKN